MFITEERAVRLLGAVVSLSVRDLFLGTPWEKVEALEFLTCSDFEIFSRDRPAGTVFSRLGELEKIFGSGEYFNVVKEIKEMSPFGARAWLFSESFPLFVEKEMSSARFREVVLLKEVLPISSPVFNRRVKAIDRKYKNRTRSLLEKFAALTEEINRDTINPEEK